jgi:hypothetical protein
MPVFLFGIGVFAVVAGLAMIGFGIPINEFSFGNTLISAGTTAAIGGLVIIAVGIAVRQLRRIADMLADPAQAAGLSRLPLPLDELEPAAASRKAPGLGAAVAPALTPALGTPGSNQGGDQGGRVAYPPRPKADAFAVEPEPAPKTGAYPDERPGESFAPSLRNPDEPSLPLDEDISLSPRHPQGARAPGAVSLDRTSDTFDWRTPPAAPSVQQSAQQSAPPPRPQPANFDAVPAAPLRSQPANFDAMWPAEGRVEGKGEGKPAKAPPSSAPAAPKPEPKDKPRTVAILKSGVVDGMGYTLYVDGSIEAELPQGTLRFASINELRSHLEKNS